MKMFKSLAKHSLFFIEAYCTSKEKDRINSKFPRMILHYNRDQYYNELETFFLDTSLKEKIKIKGFNQSLEEMLKTDKFVTFIDEIFGEPKKEPLTSFQLENQSNIQPIHFLCILLFELDKNLIYSENVVKLDACYKLLISIENVYSKFESLIFENTFGDRLIVYVNFIKSYAELFMTRVLNKQKNSTTIALLNMIKNTNDQFHKKILEIKSSQDFFKCLFNRTWNTIVLLQTFCHDKKVGNQSNQFDISEYKSNNETTYLQEINIPEINERSNEMSNEIIDYIHKCDSIINNNIAESVANDPESKSLSKVKQKYGAKIMLFAISQLSTDDFSKYMPFSGNSLRTEQSQYNFILQECARELEKAVTLNIINRFETGCEQHQHQHQHHPHHHHHHQHQHHQHQHHYD